MWSFLQEIVSNLSMFWFEFIATAGSAADNARMRTSLYCYVSWSQIWFMIMAFIVMHVLARLLVNIYCACLYVQNLGERIRHLSCCCGHNCTANVRHARYLRRKHAWAKRSATSCIMIRCLRVRMEMCRMHDHGNRLQVCAQHTYRYLQLYCRTEGYVTGEIAQIQSI
jgi:hypothetical protein